MGVSRQTALADAKRNDGHLPWRSGRSDLDVVLVLDGLPAHATLRNRTCAEHAPNTHRAPEGFLQSTAGPEASTTTRKYAPIRTMQAPSAGIAHAPIRCKMPRCKMLDGASCRLHRKPNRHSNVCMKTGQRTPTFSQISAPLLCRAVYRTNAYRHSTRRLNGQCHEPDACISTCVAGMLIIARHSDLSRNFCRSRGTGRGSV